MTFLSGLDFQGLLELINVVLASGIVIVSFCDGGQRAVNEDIDYRVYQNLMTPDSQAAGYVGSWTRPISRAMSDGHGDVTVREPRREMQPTDICGVMADTRPECSHSEQSVRHLGRALRIWMGRSGWRGPAGDR